MKQTEFKDSIFYYFENDKYIYGFTGNNCRLEYITGFLDCQDYIELTQIHSSDIRLSKGTGIKTSGDGIILNEKNRVAIIKTADCIPLFFTSEGDKNYAGIIHAGWKGLYYGIELKLLKKLEQLGLMKKDVSFLIGPSIEKKCYTVKEDLLKKFSGKTCGNDIFEKNNGKYLMDLKKGIAMSLVSNGVNPDNISDTGICTYCDSRNFPSYRRDKTPERIFNFMKIKQGFPKD